MEQLVSVSGGGFEVLTRVFVRDHLRIRFTASIVIYHSLRRIFAAKGFIERILMEPLRQATLYSNAEFSESQGGTNVSVAAKSAA